MLGTHNPTAFVGPNDDRLRHCAVYPARELLADHPAVLVVGPRACGKTTTGRRHCRERLRLDRPAEAAVVRADPDAALADGPFPLLVDEWQVVPEVLGAVKRAFDEGARAGSFVLTGSSQADLTAAGWPAECTVSELSPHLFHVRDANGRHEVDILVEPGSHSASCCTPGHAHSGWMSQSPRCPSAPYGDEEIPAK